MLVTLAFILRFWVSLSSAFYTRLYGFADVDAESTVSQTSHLVNSVFEKELHSGSSGVGVFDRRSPSARTVP
jgi:hypothetical protein